ncbi:MAG: hypothetical protein WD844_05425 [Thermoleophilaceae bacterium]
MQPDSNDGCSWCSRGLDPADCWLLADPAGGRAAAFCRLEHIVPWVIRGPRWSPGAPDLPEHPDARLVLVRRRGAHAIAEGFASVGDLADWAKAGGPWAA